MTTPQPDPTPPQPLLIPIVEAARLLSLGRSTVYELMYKGEIPYVQCGGVRRISMAAIEQWIRDHTVQGS